MTGTLFKTIEIAGIECDVAAEFEASLVDNGIGAYEYWGAKGFHHDWQWEVDDVHSLGFDGDVRERVIEHLRCIGFSSNNHRRWLKAVRRLVRRLEQALANMEPRDDIWSDDEICEHAADEAPNEDPGYDEDRAYERWRDRQVD